MQRITVAIVAYNEEGYLPGLFSDLKKQTYPHDMIEIFLIDSDSTDGTRALMEEFAGNAHSEGFFRALVLDNPKRRQSAGWNKAIRAFLDEKNDLSDALIRVDAHARIAHDFVEKCASALGQNESVVGGARPTIVQGDSAWKRMLWMAEESLFGSSVSTARRDDSPDTSGEEIKEKGKYVKSLFHACYKREVIKKAGFFREDLGRTEDNEYHYRIRRLGYRIYQSPSIHSVQYIRPSLKKMIRQKSGNGFWIGRTLGIVPGCISPYHLVPFCFVMAAVGSGLAALMGYTWLIRLLAGMYMSVAVLMTIYSSYTLAKSGGRVSGFVFLLPAVFFILHTSYGAGTLAGLVSIPFGRKEKQ